MHVKRVFTTPHSYWVPFALVLVLTVVVYILYGMNLVRWQHSPDFGWRTMYDSGPNVVAEVFAAGQAAGLRVGDTILAINGRPYTTFDELYFHIRDDTPGSVNTYTVRRDGELLEISIPTGRLGLPIVLWRSGPIFASGLLYVVIGVLVFLMKPHAAESWLFFLMTCFISVTISYSAPSDLLYPLWLFDIRRFFEVFLPAPIIHLAFWFPKTRTFALKRPWLVTVPYLLSLSLFLLMQGTSTAYWNVPAILYTINVIYMLLGVLIFLASMVWNYFKDPSVVIRLQSQVIYIGIILGFFIPVADLLVRILWNVYLFPNPVLGFVLFLSFFPLSIGYTIVKHNLFDLDTIVRRTYGYMLSTAAIIGAYALIISTLNVTFHSSEIATSPLFSITFALGVVFLFEPLYKRFQRFVDRVFYRQQYDYRKTIKDISETMISLLDPELIHKTLIGSVVKEMFLENGLLLLPDATTRAYQVQVVEGVSAESLQSRQLDKDDVLVRALEENNDAIFRYEIEVHPQYEPDREVLQHTFQSLAAELMLPMKSKNTMLGIISLGAKKSGKIFTVEDLDLLKTIANEGAIALENAILFKESLEKSRIEEELKIAHAIQLSMLPEKPPHVEGFQIAARSIPAREVGGDFYDFIDLQRDGTGSQVGIVVGDVAGKAISGALVMAAARSTFQVLADVHPSIEEMMRVANQRLNRDMKKGMFVALLYAVIDPCHKTLTFVNAGQTQPILCPGDHSPPVYLETDGDSFPLGIIKNCQYQTKQVSLKPGDTVVLYSDGAVEAMNSQNELYGFERFLASIEEGKALGAEALLEKLFHDISQYVGNAEPHDDLTIMVVKAEYRMPKA
jgi:serine phosphatase RsbU (regulator of sigma subunit)